jgi:hypothetical protein
MENGQFVIVFRKEADGFWKAIRDVNNTEAPATAVAKT